MPSVCEWGRSGVSPVNDMDNVDYDSLKEELSQAAMLSLEDPERGIRIMLVLTKAFKGVGYQIPVLVGGAAVEYYTHGWYTSGDIDALLYSAHPKVSQVMEGLGFVRKGKDWMHSALPDLYVEFPGVLGDPLWNLDPDEIEIDGHRVRIISLEGLILDKVGSYLIGSMIDGVNVLALLNAGTDQLDWEFIEDHSRAEGSWEALQRLKEVATSIDWDDPPPRAELEKLLERLKLGGGGDGIGYDVSGG